MTMHEALFFVKGLHDHTERAVSNKGPWCWPTRELLAENVAANRSKFSGQDESNFRRQFGIAKRRGWMVEAPCSAHCHAMHVSLTSVGLEVLKLMNEQGCSARCASATRPCVISGLHLHRKAA